MSEMTNIAMILAAVLSAIAAILHIAIIFGGASWYRFFGAGEQMAIAAESGRLYPAFITSIIALILFIWAAYALSGAGLLPPLPFLKLILSLITAAYLLRGSLIFWLVFFDRSKITPFLCWSSIICLFYGIVHLYGVFQIPT